MNHPSSPAPRSAWDRKLVAYFVGSAAVLGAQEANADIIYSGVQDIPIGVDQSYDLDLDGNSAIDFTLRNFFDGINRNLDITSGPGNNYSSFFGFPIPLSAGTAIPGFQKFSPGPGLLESSSSFSGFGGLGEQYLGLQFTIGGATHYGWAKISVDAGPDVTATLHDWAYDDVARRSIRTGAVPEPASLALLALGAAGVSAYRARRKRQDPSASDERA